MMEGIVAWSIVMVLGGILGGMTASNKNRDWSAWTAWGIIFPPSLAVLLLLPSRDHPPRRPTLDEEDLPS